LDAGVPGADVLIAATIVILGVVGCLLSLPTERRWTEWLGKPAASAAFLALAASRYDGSTPARWFAFALTLSAVGDLALLGRRSVAFLSGLGAFLLGHVCFLGAFLSRGVEPVAFAGALVPLSVVFLIVWRWLLPHVPARMKIPVVAYMAVITAMVAAAFGTHWRQPKVAWLLAALAFFVSDLAVARRRFVVPRGVNRLWGLPLYYGAQLVFAATIAQ
jgi:uncharacterized membrane protein YhhN